MKIVIERSIDNGATETLRFDKVSVTIGRGPDNDVVCNAPADRIVSTCHARIVEEKGRAIIEDNGSLNGLYVDDEKVSRAELKGRSSIRLGKDGPTLYAAVEAGESQKSAVTEQMPISPPKVYGERTVGMMIKQALAQAGLIKTEGTSKSTDYFEAMMDQKLRRTSGKLRWFLIGAVALVIASGVGIALYVRYNRTVQYVQTTQVNYGEAAGSAIAAANRYSVFLVVGSVPDTSEREGICTAFAVGESVLATNAHCIDTALKRYKDITVVMNGAPSNWYTVSRMVPHPGYLDGRLSPDVGLIAIGGRLANIAVMATKEELSRLSPGVPVFLYGFPGRLSRLEAPEATFISGQIGRVTRFDQSVGQLAENTLLQHSAFSSQGTSGSPIFNSEGRVIGINTGGYTEDGQVLPGYNFGMRIDLIDSLLEKAKR